MKELHLDKHVYLPGFRPDVLAFLRSQDPRNLLFRDVLRQAGRVSLTVRDVLNTGSEAMEFDQKLVPDERPQVSLHQPAADVLARLGRQ